MMQILLGWNRDWTRGWTLYLYLLVIFGREKVLIGCLMHVSFKYLKIEMLIFFLFRNLKFKCI